jgi:DNA-binding CsgD family transcriptional regulator
MKNTKDKVYIAVFILTVLIVWSALFAIPAPDEVQLANSGGVQDLSGYDFSNTIYHSNQFWECWPDAYHTPADFANGLVTEPGRPRGEMDFFTTQYFTHRVRFILPPDKTYGFMMRSVDYSMRIFINGELIDSVGNPGQSREETIPRTLRRTYYAEPQSGEVEIILHIANFVHREGAYPPRLFFGTADSIAQRNDADMLKSSALFFFLIGASLYHLGLFLINRQRKAALLFSVSCLLIAFLDYKLILGFFPDYNWFAAIRFEYINHYLVFAVLTMFFETMYPNLLHKIVTRIFYAITGIYIILTLILDPMIFTMLLYGFSAACALLAGYILVRLAMNLKSRNAQNVLIFVGLLPIILLGLDDIVRTFFPFGIGIHLILGRGFLTPVGMVFMVSCYSLVVALDYASTERRYAVALLEIAEIKKQLAEKKTMRDLSAFGFSERESEVAYLLIGSKTRDEIGELLGIARGTVNTYCNRIYKKTGSSSKEELAALLEE